MDRGTFNAHHAHGRRMDRGSTTGVSGPASAAAAAASRQKSCNACVRGKRRCDKVMPRCTRCAAKNLDCVYQKLPPMPSPASPAPCSASMACSSGPGSGPTTTASPADMTGDFDMGDLDMGACDLDLDVGAECPSATSGTSGSSTTSPETLQLDPSLDFSIADLIGSPSLWTFPGFGEPKADFPAPVPVPMMPTNTNPPDQPRQPRQPRQAQRPIRDVAILNETSLENCSRAMADPLVIHDPRSTMGFIVDYMSNLHVGFAQTRALPFLHPRLYAARLPRTIMSAFAAASAYANRTPATKAWTLRLLADAAREIHSEGSGKQSSSPLSPLDKLARVQALCVVDTMRIFDGDISLRHAAEKERPKLLEWVAELLKVVDELEGADAGSPSRDRPPRSWEHWILVESARRTALVSTAVVCLVFILTSETPDPDIWQFDKGFTASRHLWEAATSVDFFRAWREQPQWTITNGVFREFWQFARAEDLDDFTRVMLTAQVGPDAMDHHFAPSNMSIPAS